MGGTPQTTSSIAELRSLRPTLPGTSRGGRPRDGETHRAMVAQRAAEACEAVYREPPDVEKRVAEARREANEHEAVYRALLTEEN